MLSLGILAARHLSNTMRSRGFMSGSAPPNFAAMLISLLSLEKILPRLASIAPLKCLTLAHLLCPAIKSLSLLILSDSHGYHLQPEQAWEAPGNSVATPETTIDRPDDL